MQLMVLEEFVYNDKSLKRGDFFEAPDLHAKLFIEAGRAKERLQNGLIGKSADLDNRAVKAETEPEKVETESNRKRKYMRRDMRAREE